MVGIRISPQAADDLEDICQFIGKDSPFYAKELIKNILHYIKILDKFPKIGRMVPERQNPNIREIIFRSYRIIYQIKGEIVEILSV
ncbi:MAG: type II toxin-antitoxin system RelE/ParE family toxin, partial [Promethearchaeota archaeon]